MRRRLIQFLQAAYSGELAAALAYHGHAAAVREPAEREMLLKIEAEELDHRERVGQMLRHLGQRPDPTRERASRFVGRAIGALCAFSGWFMPMYVAGRLENGNIAGYEAAARAAPEFAAELLDMADREREHERWFRSKAASHRLWRLAPKWTTRAPRL